MDEQYKILVIDDEQSICVGFERFFSRRNFEVITCATGHAGLEYYSKITPDVVFLDVRLPDSNGLDILTEILQRDPSANVVIITAYGDLDTVTTAVKNRAFDYLAKPLDLDKAFEIASRAVKINRVNTEAKKLQKSDGNPLIVGSSHVMQDVYKQIGMVANSSASVLILGQTGVGKDLVAQATHRNSPRNDKPFIAVNCGALPENLIESELFGHQKGAFTGADSDRAGKFESANGGTLFLDEVGELPHSAQVKLLRVLDNKTIERVGAVKSIDLDVRILAATNRDLYAEVQAGRFRSDLYYRLNVFHIKIPPLCNRKDDIVQISNYFLKQLAPETHLSEQAIIALQNHSWPGNVRELRNAIHHSAVLAVSGAILPEHLPRSVFEPAEPVKNWQEYLTCYLNSLPKSDNMYRYAVENLERELIQNALYKCNGNQSEASELIGLHRNTMRKKIRELNIKK